MSETTDPNSQILLVAILALYWAMLGSWSQLLSRWNDERAKRNAVPPQQDVSTEHASCADVSQDALRKIDPDFDLAAFLSGARRAYEAILRAFADSDIQTLQRLVGPEVLAAFEREIVGRRDRREVLELTFIGTDEAKVVNASVADGTAEIVVRYVPPGIGDVLGSGTAGGDATGGPMSSTLSIAGIGIDVDASTERDPTRADTSQP